MPSFTPPSAAPDHWRMFNARAEGLATKSVFSRLLNAGAGSSSSGAAQQQHTGKTQQQEHGCKEEEKEGGVVLRSSSQLEIELADAAAHDVDTAAECGQQEPTASKAAAGVLSSPSGHGTGGAAPGASSPHASKAAASGAGRPKRCIHRCVVLLNGFYEWKADAKGKQPYYISRGEDTLLLAAGLWDTWTGEGRRRGAAGCNRSLAGRRGQLPSGSDAGSAWGMWPCGTITQRWNAATPGTHNTWLPWHVERSQSEHSKPTLHHQPSWLLQW